MNENTCRICDSKDLSSIFNGKIRDGKFGNLTKESHIVLKCQRCGSAFLEDKGYSSKEFYESSEYRESVNNAPDPLTYQKNHDWEQIRHLEMAGTKDIRGKRIMDVGCGAGSFLDFFSGVAEKIYAIEPHEVYKKYLSDKGYQAYSYASDLVKEKGSIIDNAYCFSVIEHIEDPLSFLRDIHATLRDGGSLTLSTPNTRDLLIDLLPEEYQPFYFRKVHEWYFEENSLRYLFEKVGFKEVEIRPFQRFGFSNFVNWLIHKRPMGNEKLASIPAGMESTWKSQLENEMRSDYLFVEAIK